MMQTATQNEGRLEKRFSILPMKIEGECPDCHKSVVLKRIRQGEEIGYQCQNCFGGGGIFRYEEILRGYQNDR